MNTVLNLIRAPFKLKFGNVYKSLTYTNLPQISKESLFNKCKGILNCPETQTYFSTLPQKGYQPFLPKIQHGNKISLRSNHLLSRSEGESLRSIFESNSQKTSLLGFLTVRTKCQVLKFQNPSEIKRLKKHGYYARLRTKSGREVLMRRILKGRHCLAH